MTRTQHSGGRAEHSPSLLEVVPWNYGYAHSWALRWLIENAASRDAILGALLPDDAPPWTIEGSVDREHAVPGARADLACNLVDGRDRAVALAVETKVADPIKRVQLERYRDEGFETVLYVPGLTGLLFEPNGAVAGERWVTGRDVAAALEPIDLPWIISSYLDTVAGEASRMDDARAVARGEIDAFDHDGCAPAKDLADAAWIVEVAYAMRAGGAEDVRIRSERNDRGIFWAGAHLVPAGITEDAGMWIDIVADIRSNRRAVVIKAGGQPAGRMACYEAAIAAGPPQPADGWTAGRCTTKPASFTVWRIDATDKKASETAQLALGARAFMTDLADPTR
ncbi:MAG: hypothetical protein ABI427_20450 [Solirubrobacteraceae bacterium]